MSDLSGSWYKERFRLDVGARQSPIETISGYWRDDYFYGVAMVDMRNNTSEGYNISEPNLIAMLNTGWSREITPGYEAEQIPLMYRTPEEFAKSGVTAEEIAGITEIQTSIAQVKAEQAAGTWKGFYPALGYNGKQGLDLGIIFFLIPFLLLALLYYSFKRG